MLWKGRLLQKCLVLVYRSYLRLVSHRNSLDICEEGQPTERFSHQSMHGDCLRRLNISVRLLFCVHRLWRTHSFLGTCKLDNIYCLYWSKNDVYLGKRGKERPQVCSFQEENEWVQRHVCDRQLISRKQIKFPPQRRFLLNSFLFIHHNVRKIFSY